MSAAAPIRVMTVDDHPLMREGIATMVRNEPDMLLVAEAANGSDALLKHRQHQPDITLMDLRLPDRNGIDVLVAIRAECPEARIIMLTTSEGDVEIRRALSAGAYGYLLKSMDSSELIRGIRDVWNGKKRIPAEVAERVAKHMSEELLTARELEVLQHASDGSRNREIAERLFITEDTVKVHMKHVLEKLGARDRTEAVAIAVRRGILHL